MRSWLSFGSGFRRECFSCFIAPASILVTLASPPLDLASAIAGRRSPGRTREEGWERDEIELRLGERGKEERREGGRERGREEGREGGRERGKERAKERGRKGERGERGREPSITEGEGVVVVA